MNSGSTDRASSSGILILAVHSAMGDATNRLGADIKGPTVPDEFSRKDRSAMTCARIRRTAAPYVTDGFLATPARSISRDWGGV